ncbi:hypothetical protein R6867_19700, partial [Mycobacterium tuberculosis]
LFFLYPFFFFFFFIVTFPHPIPILPSFLFFSYSRHPQYLPLRFLLPLQIFFIDRPRSSAASSARRSRWGW